jgi:hypothetical protein
MIKLVFGNENYSSRSLRAWLPLERLRSAMLEWREAAHSEPELSAEDEPYR